MEIKDQMRLLSGSGMWHTEDIDGQYDTVFMSDGPHGLRAQNEKVRKNNESCEATCFPTASALAASWDKDLVASVADGIADEAKAEGVSILLGPGVNIKRSPLCGRNFEYFSEDPYLAGTLAASYINAVQKEGVGTSLKHFACNSQERFRMRENSQVDERTLNEIYLRAFEIAVKKAQPATVMASYNRINGEYACANKELLTDTLRNKWGFKGAVISDWGACQSLAKCVKAGMDLEMPGNGGAHMKELYEAYENGEISEEEIKKAADRVLALVEKYGERHSKTVFGEERKALLARNHERAVEAAKECAVLLKNDGILPLAKDTELTVIGDLAAVPRIQGGGSSHINTKSVKNFLEILENRGAKFTYERGYDQRKTAPDVTLEDRAVNAAKQAKGPVIFFGGLTDIAEGEGFDRENLNMPSNQIRLLKRLKKLNKDLIFVSFGGSPFDLAPAAFSKAILHMYLCGEGVMEACSSLLFGESNPCGKLAETFPYSIIDTPAYGNFSTFSEDICYLEGLFVGYRYYDGLNIDVAYPFGYGLSYTSYEYSDLEILGNPGNGEKVKVRFNIKNTGKVAGRETAQVYVVNRQGRLARAVKELRGFDKKKINPGETVGFEIELDEYSFKIYNVYSGKFETVNGEYEIVVGASSRDIRLSKKLMVNAKEALDLSGENYRPHIMREEEFVTLYNRPLSNYTHVKPGQFDLSNSINQLSRHSKAARTARFMLKRVGDLMYFGRSKKDPEVRMFTETVLDGPIDVVVCQSGGVLKLKWAKKLVEHVNKKKNAPQRVGKSKLLKRLKKVKKTLRKGVCIKRRLK